MPVVMSLVFLGRTQVKRDNHAIHLPEQPYLITQESAE